MKRCSVFLSVGAVVCLAVSVMAQGEAEDATPIRLTRDLKAVLLHNFAATEKADLDGVAATLHPDSPVREASLAMTRQTLNVYRLHAELLEFRYVGTDGLYAIGRGKQKTVKLKGPDGYRDNVLDSLYVFRRHGGTWKLWQQAALESTFLE